MILIYPQLAVTDTLLEIEKLERALNHGNAPQPFADGTLHPKSIFAGTIGMPVDMPHLLKLHDKIFAALPAAPRDGTKSKEWNRKFDIAVGKVFVEWFGEYSPAAAADPAIWPYLTLVVLPDVAVQRFGLNSAGKLSVARYTAGRRNVFYRTYLRASALGPLLDDPELPLFEDELVSLMDRNLSADTSIALVVASEIREIPKGGARRERVRQGFIALMYELRVTDLAGLEVSDLTSIVRACFHP